MGGEPTQPPATQPPHLSDPLHPSSSRDPKGTPHVFVSILPGHIGLTPSPDSQQLTIQQLTRHLDERDAEMEAMRAQLSKLTKTAKKKTAVETTATSYGGLSGQRRSAKDRTGDPNNERAHNKALVLRHGDLSTEHLSRGHHGDSSRHYSSQISESSARSPYSQLSASHETVYYFEDGEYKPVYLRKDPKEAALTERSSGRRRHKTPPQPTKSADLRARVEQLKKTSPQEPNLIVIRDGDTGKRHAHRTDEKAHHDDAGGKRKEKESREQTRHHEHRHERPHDERHLTYTEKRSRTSDGFVVLSLPPLSSLPPLPSVDERLKQLAKSPFTKEIISATLPAGFTLPKFNRYDALTDAYNHLIYFRQTINLYTSDQAIMCKVFPTSLGTLGSKSDLFTKVSSIFQVSGTGKGGGTEQSCSS